MIPQVRSALLSLVLYPGFAYAQVNPSVQVASTPMSIVFDWQRDRCTQWDIPDAPLRAFTSADGQVVAFASSYDNRPLTGKSLSQLKHTCQSSLVSRAGKDPARYEGLRYVTATWTADGIHVAGLIHNEYHAERFGTCSYVGSMQCWYNTILAASSDTSGMTFFVQSPPRVVAAVPFTQAMDQGRHRGFFNPSNILFRDGNWYMAANTTGEGEQRSGTCLFRSSDVNDPDAWKSFTGRDFSGPSVDPYRDDTRSYVPCQPMTGVNTLGSISYYPSKSLYLGVFQGPDQDHPNGNIGYAWSKDMLHWGPHATLIDRPDMSSKNCSDTERYGYPSVLDSRSPDRNFAIITKTPYLFVTRFQVKDCKLSPNRDLIRLELRIDP